MGIKWDNILIILMCIMLLILLGLLGPEGIKFFKEVMGLLFLGVKGLCSILGEFFKLLFQLGRFGIAILFILLIIGLVKIYLTQKGDRQ